MTDVSIKTVQIFVEGEAMTVPAGISVAAAVLGHTHKYAHKREGTKAFHHNSMDASPRAPYCLMGVCFECMMEINGQENIQSCLVAVEEGMQVKRQYCEAFQYTTQEAFDEDAEQEHSHV